MINWPFHLSFQMENHFLAVEYQLIVMFSIDNNKNKKNKNNNQILVNHEEIKYFQNINSFVICIISNWVKYFEIA